MIKCSPENCLEDSLSNLCDMFSTIQATYKLTHKTLVTVAHLGIPGTQTLPSTALCPANFPHKVCKS
jgi:hypothetical protein